MKNNHDNDVNNNENKNYNTTFKQNEIWKRFLSMMNGLVTHSFTERASTVVVRKQGGQNKTSGPTNYEASL